MPLALQDHVARRARPEQDGMIARQLDELDASLTVVYFQGGHAAASWSSWATTSKS